MWCRNPLQSGLRNRQIAHNFGWGTSTSSSAGSKTTGFVTSSGSREGVRSVLTSQHVTKLKWKEYNVLTNVQQVRFVSKSADESTVTDKTKPSISNENINSQASSDLDNCPPLTMLQKRRYALQCAVPFVGFGFMDNMIMICVGDMIDAHFSAYVSTLTAAALGQCCSDVSGTVFGGVVDAVAAKIGLPDARVSHQQANLPVARVIKLASMASGVIFGCLLGMFPLLFIDTQRNERIKQGKELRSLFKSIAEEGQRSLNVERCSLYIDEDGDASALWALAKKWTPSRDQLDDCIRRSQTQQDPNKLSVKILQDRFKEMKFRKYQLPTNKEYIHPDELPQLLKKMLGTADKLEKKKIRKTGTKYILLKAQDPELVLNIRDVYEDPRFSKSRKYSVEKRTVAEDAWRAHSVLIGPVTRDGKVIGCIEMINKKSLPDLEGGCVPFSKNDERLMKLLCNHCSIFLNQLDRGEDINDVLNSAMELN